MPDVASDRGAADAVAARLEDELHRVFPETAGIAVRHREVPSVTTVLITPDPWEVRPGVRTPSPRLVLASAWVRCDHPVALMERAATTGFLAAKELLGGWGARERTCGPCHCGGILARPTR